MNPQRLVGSLLLGASLAHGGGVFWSDRGDSQLKRMNFDGSGLQTITLSGEVTVAGSNVRGIAVDNVLNRIFWADNGADRVLRANFDGTSSVILYAITGGNSFPADVHLDQENALLYWCDRDRRRIQRSTFDGLAVTDAIPNAAATGPYFMDLDVAAGKIYWGDSGGGAIYRANLDGTGRETLLTGNNSTRGVGVDPGGGMLYWINRNDKKVHRCALSAFANGTIPLTHPAVQTLYDNLDTPHGLMLDIPARKLYWADTGTNPGSGNGGSAVSRGDFDGGTPQEILATGSQPWDVDLDRRCATYAEWRQRCFRRDAPATQTDPGADPDGDTIPNAMEYAFDLPPRFANTDGFPKAFLTSGPEPGAQYLALRYRHRATTSDLSVYTQTSTDLLNWVGSRTEPQTVQVQTNPLADGMEEVTVRTLEPITNQASQFLRLKVVLTGDW